METLSQQRDTKKRSKSELQHLDTLEQPASLDLAKNSGLAALSKLSLTLQPLKTSVIRKLALQEEKKALQHFRGELNANLDKLKSHATRANAFKSLQRLIIDNKSAEYLKYTLSSLSAIRNDRNQLSIECKSTLVGIIAREYASGNGLADPIKLASRLISILCSNTTIADIQIGEAISTSYELVYTCLLASQDLSVKEGCLVKPLENMLLHGSNSKIQNIGASVLKGIYRAARERDDEGFKKLVCSIAIESMIRNSNYLSGFADLIDMLLTAEDPSLTMSKINELTEKFLVMLQDESKLNDTKRKLELMTLFINIGKFCTRNSDILPPIDTKLISNTLKQLTLSGVPKIVELARICEREWQIYKTATGTSIVNNSEAKLQTIIHKSYLNNSINSKFLTGLNASSLIQGGPVNNLRSDSPLWVNKDRHHDKPTGKDIHYALTESFVIGHKKGNFALDGQPRKPRMSTFTDKHDNRNKRDFSNKPKPTDQSNGHIQVYNIEKRDQSNDNSVATNKKGRETKKIDNKANRNIETKNSLIRKKSSFMRNHEMVKELIQKDREMHLMIKKASKTLEELERDSKFAGVNEKMEEERRRTIIMDQNDEKMERLDISVSNIPSCENIGNREVIITPKEIETKHCKRTVRDIMPENEPAKIKLNKVITGTRESAVSKNNSSKGPSPQINKKLRDTIKTNGKKLQANDKKENIVRKPINDRKLLSMIKNDSRSKSRSISLKSKKKTNVSVICGNKEGSINKINTIISPNVISMPTDDNEELISPKPLKLMLKDSKLVSSVIKRKSSLTSKDSSHKKNKIVKKSNFATINTPISISMEHSTLETDKGQQVISNNVIETLRPIVMNSNKSFEGHETRALLNTTDKAKVISINNHLFEEEDNIPGDQTLPTRRIDTALSDNNIYMDGRLGNNDQPYTDNITTPKTFIYDDNPTIIVNNPTDEPKVTFIAPGTNDLTTINRQIFSNNAVFEETIELGTERYIKPVNPKPKTISRTITDPINENPQTQPIYQPKSQNIPTVPSNLSIDKDPDICIPVARNIPSSKNPLRSRNDVVSLKDIGVCYSTITEESYNYTEENLSMEKTRYIDVNMQSTVLFDKGEPVTMHMLPNNDNKRSGQGSKKAIHMVDTVIFENQQRIGTNLNCGEKMDNTVLVSDRDTRKNELVDRQLWSAVQDFIKRGDFNTAFQLGLNFQNDKYIIELCKRTGKEIKGLKGTIRSRVVERVARIQGFEHKENDVSTKQASF